MTMPRPGSLAGALSCVLAAAVAGGRARAAGPKDASPPHEKMRAYQTPYYVIYSDLDEPTVREAAVRMTAMAEEYHKRTRGFAGAIRTRLPFCLFRKKEDYYAAGGIKGSAGTYRGDRLLACAPDDSARTWHVVQHEGFHQFAHHVITPRLPIWVNEGMAEYFGEGVWTGDGFVTGLIPPYRLKRVQGLAREGGKLLPFPAMLLMTHQEWNDAARKKDEGPRNYDQAWSMVHFLAHADDGKYQAAFVAFINDIARGRPYAEAFTARVGGNIEAFQKRYAAWWGGLDDNPTVDLYIQAVVQTLTSHLARAMAAGQQFATAEEFLHAAREGKLKCPEALWLPPSLLERAMKPADSLRDWSLVRAPGRFPKLVLTLPDGRTFTGVFLPRVGRGPEVTVTQTKSPPAAKAPPASKPS